MLMMTKYLCLLTILTTAQSVYIPYQAHGFNDLPYMMQLIKKGVTYLKMDVSPVVRESCEQYSNWQQEPCEVYSNGFEVCCLGFRGDTGSFPIYKQEFNITNEFIKTLRAYPQYFSKSQAKRGYEDIKVFAFNFQYDDIFTRLSKEFLYDLALITNDPDINVQILIGSDRFLNAYVLKCEVECDDVDRYIATAQFRMQTTEIHRNDPEEDNFNTFFENIVSLCQSGWPEWVNEFGMIFWEPSHEYQVQLCREQFEDPKCKISDRLRKVENLRIASNLEPETLQVYWKKPIFSDEFDSDDQKQIRYGDYTHPQVDYYQKCGLNIVGYQNQDNYVIEVSPNFVFLWFKIQGQGNLVKMRIEGDYLLVQTDNELQVYLFNDCTQLQLANKLDVKYGDNIAFTEHELVKLDIDKFEETVTFLFYDIYTNALTGQVTIDVGPMVKSDILNLVFDVVHTDMYYIAMSFTKYGYIYEHDQYKKIYLTLLTVADDYSIVDYTPAIQNIDFGLIGNIKLYVYDQVVYMISIQSDSVCQAAILLNNNDWNKCTYENYAQYASLNNVEHMIDYYWGTFQALQYRVEQGKKVNGCDQDIMHAKLGNGDKPNIALKFSTDTAEAIVVTEYVPYHEQGAFTQLFCGSTNDYPQTSNSVDGLLLFTFNILHPDRM